MDLRSINRRFKRDLPQSTQGPPSLSRQVERASRWQVILMSISDLLSNRMKTRKTTKKHKCLKITLDSSFRPWTKQNARSKWKKNSMRTKETSACALPKWTRTSSSTRTPSSTATTHHATCTKLTPQERERT
jgi:hypothetical protein